MRTIYLVSGIDADAEGNDIRVQRAFESYADADDQLDRWQRLNVRWVAITATTLFPASK